MMRFGKILRGTAAICFWAAWCSQASAQTKEPMRASECIRHTAKLTFADGKSAKVTVCEGQMATLMNHSQKRGIGITPVAAKDGKGHLTLHLAEIALDTNEREIATHKAAVDVRVPGEATVDAGGMRITIEMLVPEPKGEPVASTN